MGSRLRIELDSLWVSTKQGRNMSGKQAESYEAPTVEEIDADVKPIATVPGGTVSS
jgi:hypothetical protein